MWFNILLFIYLGFVILTYYYINQKVNPNKYPFQNPYMQQYNIYGNLKTKFRLHGIENRKQKQNTMKHKCFFSIKILFYLLS